MELLGWVAIVCFSLALGGYMYDKLKRRTIRNKLNESKAQLLKHVEGAEEGDL